MHTEVSEYTQLIKRYGLDEAHRKERASEVADMVIRAMAFAILEGIDLEGEIREKMSRNFSRPYAYGTPGETLTEHEN